MKNSHFFTGKTGDFEAVIGVEIHAQIASASKLFSGASTQSFGQAPNQCVAFLDAGFPGTLPVVNAWCVHQGIKTGLAIGAHINGVSIFERKNYFYPDLPSGYQISQFKTPLVEHGQLVIDTPQGSKTIGIRRIHLEQDAGKNIHDRSPFYSFVDLNRSGIGLMESVTEPDMNTPDEVIAYVKKFRTLLRWIETCSGDMEKGCLRVDANISLRRPGEPLGTRVELKNMNSFRFLRQALFYEIERQMEVLEKGEKIRQETRGYDAHKGETYSLREKEDCDDYRYFPDPDLPPLKVSQEWIQRVRQEMPLLPDALRDTWMEKFGLSRYEAGLLVEEKEVADFFQSVVAELQSPSPELYRLVTHWITGELFSCLKRDNLDFNQCPLKPNAVAALVVSIHGGDLSSTLAKEVFSHMWKDGSHPHEIMEQKNLRQISDESVIALWVEELLVQEAKHVAEYLSGKEKLFGFLVGQLMKRAQGKANPQVLQMLLKKALVQKSSS